MAVVDDMFVEFNRGRAEYLMRAVNDGSFLWSMIESPSDLLVLAGILQHVAIRTVGQLRIDAEPAPSPFLEHQELTALADVLRTEAAISHCRRLVSFIAAEWLSDGSADFSYARLCEETCEFQVAMNGETPVVIPSSGYKPAYHEQFLGR